MTDCPFCPKNWPNLNIIERHEERDYSIAVIHPLDPVTEGHVLVISEPHSRDASLAYESFPAMMVVAAGYVRRHKIQANIITSIGEHATQTVFHTHIHVVPRTRRDHLLLPWTLRQQRRDREEYIDRIKTALAGKCETLRKDKP